MTPPFSAVERLPQCREQRRIRWLRSSRGVTGSIIYKRHQNFFTSQRPVWSFPNLKSTTSLFLPHYLLNLYVPQDKDLEDTPYQTYPTEARAVMLFLGSLKVTAKMDDKRPRRWGWARNGANEWLRVLFQGMTSGDSQAEKKTDKKSLCVVAVAVGHHCTSSPVTSVHAAKSLPVAPDKALTC